MAWRKWLVRGLVFAVAGTLAAGAVVYQHWTNPAVVRRQVLDKLADKVPGARISVESARLRLLGGIAVNELRLAHRDDPDGVTLLYVPSGVIYHDKEQLLHGRLVIRKIEMERPRLRLVRERDGRWNLTGLIAPPDLSEPLPTLVVRGGVLTLEDRRAPPGTPPIEVREAFLQVINDPDLSVTFEGHGVSDVLGPVTLSGSWQRDTGALTVTLDASTVPIGPPLLQRLASLCPQSADIAANLTGTGTVRAIVSYTPESTERWSHDITLSLANGCFSHRLLPMSLEGLEASLRCIDGHIPRIEVSARSGTTTLHVIAEDITLPWGHAAEGCFSLDNLLQKLDVKIEGLPVSRQLFDALPEAVQTVYNDYLPSGLTDVRFELRPEGVGLWRRRLLIKPRGMKLTFVRFPYTVTGVSGTVEEQSGGPGGERLLINLQAQAAEQPVRVLAEFKGERPNRTGTIDVWGNNIPIDDQLLAALPEKQRSLAQSFHASGLVDFHVHAQRDSPTGDFVNRYLMTFHHARVCYEPFRYPLENVSGVLDIYDGGWEFRNFRGTHGDAVFATHGRSQRRSDGEHVQVEIAGRGVLLDADLHAALAPDLQRVWKTFSPAGRVDFDGTLHLPPASAGQPPKPAIDLSVVARDCSVQPEFFRYSLSHLRGNIHYAQDTVELENITARHGRTVIGLDRAVVQLKPEGGFKADLTHLHAAPLVPDDEFLRALPREPLRKMLAALDVRGSAEVHTRLYIDAPPGTDPPRIYWDGSVTLNDASVRTGVQLDHITGTVASRGWFNGTGLDGVRGNIDLRELSIFNQPLRNLRGEVLVTEDEPEVLKLPGLMASYFGGEVYGPVRVEFGSKLRYEMDLTASQVNLEQFGRHTFGGKTEINGQAVARLFLKGEGDDVSSLRGSGRIDVPSGKLYNLPVLLDLLKFLGLRWPDRTAFEEMHTQFDIEGLTAHVRELELYGAAISLRGQGDVGLDGSELDLDFNVDLAQIGRVLPPGVRAVPREISNQLLKIEMQGKPGDLRFNMQPVPGVMEPLKRWFGGDER